MSILNLEWIKRNVLFSIVVNFLSIKSKADKTEFFTCEILWTSGPVDKWTNCRVVELSSGRVVEFDLTRFDSIRVNELAS